MDGAVTPRKQALLAKLKARTGPDGKALPNYAENVAAIKAELERINQIELQTGAQHGEKA